MRNRQIQKLTLIGFKPSTLTKAIALMVGMLVSCVSSCAATEAVDLQQPVIYQSQQNIFGHRSDSQPFLVDQTRKPIIKSTKSVSTGPVQDFSLPLMSMPSGQPQTASDDKSEASTKPPEVASNEAKADIAAASQPSITELADTLQWTILFLTAIVGIALGVHRLTKNKQQTKQNHRMEYQGSLPIRGQFSMHLVRIIDRQFLVTTDRTGVKTVNALNEWDQFTAPIDLSGDDQFPDPQVDSKPRHHG